ncbi:hypothetical protein ACU7AI_23540 [Pseudomonas aeruginosa]|uniref:hypothetical protein n=1 Tax=Pseudomonas putida TaxID=303 RepID=UPI003F89C062
MGAIKLERCGKVYISNGNVNGTDVAVELIDVESASIENMLVLNTKTAVKGRRVGSLKTDNVSHFEKAPEIISLADSIRRAIHGYV